MKKIYGFESIKKNIIDCFLNNKLHHCNLINGVEGTGKASFIYNEIATFILSETNSCKKEDIDSFAINNTLKLIENNGHPDLFILDLNTVGDNGKVNSSKKGEINVEQSRKIINEIKFTPAVSKNKVLIIDSIDSLNINAQNALLKTLEEPPKDTFLFLICHNINKVITTIKSRSNLINLQNLSFEDWGSALFSNEDIQDVEISDDDIADLYNISNKSVGFAMSILSNNVLNFYDKILDVVLNKDIVKIQQFTAEIFDQEKFNFMSIFFDKIIMDIINYRITENNNNSFTNKRKDTFDYITKRNSTEKILSYYNYFYNMINDINNYNLDKNQAINVLINNIKL